MGGVTCDWGKVTCDRERAKRVTCGRDMVVGMKFDRDTVQCK